MIYCHFNNTSKKFTTAILIKESAFSEPLLRKHYVEYLVSKGIPSEDIIAMSLTYAPNNKAPIKLVNECLEAVLKALKHVGVKTLYVADATYFKKLTGVRKVEPHLGYALPCKIKGYEGFKVIAGTNYQAIFHDPSNADKLLTSLHTLKCHLGGKLVRLGSDIIHSSEYPSNILEISQFLDKLHQYPKLFVDIETFSLKFWETGVASIGFSWDKNNGGAFLVDAIPITSEDTLEGDIALHLQRRDNRKIRKLLANFFKTYKGTCIYHKGSFDIKILTHSLFMKSDIDYAGMNEGIEYLCRDIEDTGILAYLSLNRCGATSAAYSLKVLAQEYAGNYAQENIKDIRRIPVGELLKYNLVDCLSTSYIYDKYRPIMLQDKQEDVYKTIFLPSLRALVKAELVGMPIDLDRVNDVDLELGVEAFRHEQLLKTNPHVMQFERKYREALATIYNISHKVKRKTADDFKKKTLNINSNDEVSDLLYEHIGLPIIETTATGKPSCSGDTLKSLKNHTSDPMVHRVLDAITGITEIEKIRNTFIKAFKENTIRKQDGNTYLHGNFNLGGTVSGRLSSSNPNLTNIPSGSTYGKLIKSCFKSNDKWLFCGADYNALEARADALWTKDKNKLAIYEGGYDSHSYNTYAYWPSKFPDITAAIADIPENDHKARAEHINKIDGLYSKERSASKPVTFALQFKGTSYTLHKRAGFPMDEAETIVANYANLYKESKEATDIRIAKAVEEGYVTVAFGLRVRTPLLKMAVIDDPKNMPPIIAAEIRTAANAMSQSYGQLTNLVMVKTIRDSEEAGYATDILPCCIIHDAAYFICRRNVTALKFLNDCLGKHMAWVPPELYHPTVGLSGEMECFYPAWSTPIKIPNEASKEEIREIFNNV